MNTKPIYTIENDCMDCYKCIRNCPSKAIKITEQKASIIDELCIYCGRCVSVCPANAKQIRDGVSRVKQLIKSGTTTIASVAPSFRSEFPHFTDEEFITQLTNLGFNYISETALGAQIVTGHTEQFLKARNKGVYISSACPGVVELIKKYYPQHVVNIIPFLSPMLAHAKSLKANGGKDTKIVFIGPCIAKKAEADNWPSLVDTAITFNELKEWINESDKPETNSKGKTIDFYPERATNGNIYPIEGGMINTFGKGTNNLLKLSFAGIDEVKKVLNTLNTIQHDGPVFLELLLCEGGCINGPGCSEDNNPVQRKIEILNSKPKENTTKKENPILLNIECDYFGQNAVILPDYKPEDIQEALYSIGKHSPKDELNCGSCGYNTCREFAMATLSGMAETNMCVSHLKKIAHHQATLLLKKIPSGVILVDSDLNIKEINQSCLNMLQLQNNFDSQHINSDLVNKSINELGYFTEHFTTAIHTGKEYNQLPVVQNGKSFQLSIFNIQKYKLVAGIIQNFENKEFRSDIIEKRTRIVIKKNMETVQKIAALLGENASFTDSLLNSILTDYSEENSNHLNTDSESHA
ncbi:[Fe-Fe] hydrogenase large subunit C-terminal domain-containing protein [Plebeiibacterium sediminum]|uniref:4Fe-4S binding protein n=1 Tax=Plebeiibacterium sediminum TaxID=2992112 RepID=A0AAE3M4Y6_9BACT|nr:[Fe-Fe] hydrogenase large subunit C-terminal domain-containing protein [Plebeiobacterium sediminum]MCW3787346.1 4Fe-4S binding protein [Plebeiobacterium sediminum]